MYRRGDIMSFNQTEYISKFNKNNYKMYQFRVKKSDVNIINHLDNIENRNGYIVSLINTDIKNSIYTIKEIKNIIKPILIKYGITEIYLFGSYARGEAKETSDIDIYCNKGNIKTLIDQGLLEDELETSLNITLFKRTAKGVELTEAGNILYKYTSSAMELLETGLLRLESLKTLDDGELKIGASDTISSHFLLPRLEMFHKLYPNIKIKIINKKRV